MVVDTSPSQPSRSASPTGTLDALVTDPDQINLSAVTMVEAGVVIESRLGSAGAVAAWRQFGKGRHPAALNLGDCFAYALARALDEPPALQAFRVLPARRPCRPVTVRIK